MDDTVGQVRHDGDTPPGIHSSMCHFRTIFPFWNIALRNLHLNLLNLSLTKALLEIQLTD